ncbi:MAG: tail fiber domain-containing protein [Cyanobacteria bacterium P01_G01_bin.54]
MVNTKTRDQLQNLFKSGTKPSEADFKDLIGSSLNLQDDGIEKPAEADSPLKISAQGELENVLDFYGGQAHTWRLNQKPTKTAQGLNLATAAGESKLFIESSTGNLGVSTLTPAAKLHIVQASENQPALRIDDTLNDTTPLVVDAAGQVGIGTDAPTTQLTVKGAAKITDSLSIGNRLNLADNAQIVCNNDNNHRLLFRRSEDILELREYGKIVFSSGSQGGLKGKETARMVLDKDGNLTVQGGLSVVGAVQLGYEKSSSDLGACVRSGFYQGDKASGAVPDSSHTWNHLIAARHSNTRNHHQLQIASAYTSNDRLFFRKIRNSKAVTSNPDWHEVATRGSNTFTGDQSVTAGQLKVVAGHNNKTATIGTFYAQNLTQGVGIGYNRIEAIGSNENQDICLNPKGNGKLVISNDLEVTGTIVGNIDTSQIKTGTLNVDRIPNLNANKITAGSFHANRIPNLNTSKITAGSFHADRIPNLNASKITAGSFHTDRIPNLNANKLTAGSLNAARIPNLNANKITAGSLNAARIPNLNASKITAGSFHADRIPTLSGSKIKNGTLQGTIGIGGWLYIKNGKGMRFYDTSNKDYWRIYPQWSDADDPDLMFDYSAKTNKKDWVRGWLDPGGGWKSPSDRRLKCDIQPLTNILERVLSLQPRSYHWINSSPLAKVQVGFIAQEVEEIFPDFVSNQHDYKGLGYADFSVVAVAAIQEQHNLIIKLQEEVALLKSKLA